MGGGENFQNFGKYGGANKLKWTEKIENSVIDPLQLAREDYATGKRKGVIPKHIREKGAKT